jgi:pyruvate formate lyase activating enzyme
VDELTARLLRDRAFFENSGGGVTVSGGEPTVHMEFLAELLRRLKSEHVHTLLQTCGAFALSTFEARVYPHLDLIHFDLKLFDPTAHQAYCGADNERILQNFARLVALARGGGVPVLARVPLVPGVTAEPRNLGALAAFLREQGVAEVQLMPYNPLWPTKTRQLGRAPSAHAQAATWMDPAELAQCAQVFRRSDIQVLGRLQRG